MGNPGCLEGFHGVFIKKEADDGESQETEANDTESEQGD